MPSPTDHASRVGDALPPGATSSFASPRTSGSPSNLSRNRAARTSKISVTGVVTKAKIAIRSSCSTGRVSPRRGRRLFQPFVTTKPGGIGIGLSICRSVVDAHGGKRGVEPQGRPAAIVAEHPQHVLRLVVEQQDQGADETEQQAEADQQQHPVEHVGLLPATGRRMHRDAPRL
jgi:hypothetical protein